MRKAYADDVVGSLSNLSRRQSRSPTIAGDSSTARRRGSGRSGFDGALLRNRSLNVEVLLDEVDVDSELLREILLTFSGSLDLRNRRWLRRRRSRRRNDRVNAYAGEISLGVDATSFDSICLNVGIADVDGRFDVLYYGFGKRTALLSSLLLFEQSSRSTRFEGKTSRGAS